MKKYLFQIVTVLFLSGCATSDPASGGRADDDSDLDFNGNDCILIRTIRDYTSLDKEHLLIYGTGNRAYFVRLFRPTFEMHGSIGIRVVSRDDRLCPFGGDGIVFGSFGDDTVPVRSISRVTAEQEEYLLTRYGIKQPARQQAPAEPENVKGADVEELGQAEPGFL